MCFKKLLNCAIFLKHKIQCFTLWLSCVAPCNDAPVYLEQNSNRPGNTGLEHNIEMYVFQSYFRESKHCPGTKVGVCIQYLRNVLYFSPVVSNIEGVQALCEALHVVGTDFLQEVDVIFRVETTHVVLRCFIWFEHLRGKIQYILHYLRSPLYY